MTGRLPTLSILARAVGLLAAASCAGPPPGAGSSPADAAPAVRPGTVGAAVAAYRLTMPDVRRLRAALRDVGAYAQRNPGFHAKLDFPMDSTVESQARRVVALEPLRAAVVRAGLTPRDFVVTTAAYTGASMAAQLRDSLGERGVPQNVAPANLRFLREHAAELDSLQAPP